MASPKIRLETNIPFLGTIKYCDFYDEKPNPNEPGKMMSAQWGLKGSFVRCNPDGTRDLLDGVVYLDTYQLSADPVQLGLAAPNGLRDGKPQFKWLHAGQIQLVKREEGRKRIIQIARVGEAPTTMATVPPVQSLGAPFTPRPTNGNLHIPAAVAPAAQTTGTPGTVVTHPAPQDEWAALEARYARCCGIATRVWNVQKAGLLDADFSDQALVAAAATLFIEANKGHLDTAPGYYPVTLPVPAGAAPATPQVQAYVQQMHKNIDQAILAEHGVATPELTHPSPPRPEQIAQFRALLGTDDPYGGGPVFDTAERQALMAEMSRTTTQSIVLLMGRMQKSIGMRTTKTPPPATRTAGGPGMPGAFDEMPEAFQEDESLEGLPF